KSTNIDHTHDKRCFRRMVEHLAASHTKRVSCIGIAFPQVAKQQQQSPEDHAEIIQHQNEIALTKGNGTDGAENDHCPVANEKTDDTGPESLATRAPEASPVRSLGACGN